MGPEFYEQHLVKTPVQTENTSVIVDDVKIKAGQWINKGQLMIVLKIKIINPSGDTNEYKTIRLKADSSGKVMEVCVRKGEETTSNNILARISKTPCPHSTLMKNMCADCGADLEHEDQHLGNNI